MLQVPAPLEYPCAQVDDKALYMKIIAFESRSDTKEKPPAVGPMACVDEDD
jgi:hypothetical protein